MDEDSTQARSLHSGSSNEYPYGFPPSRNIAPQDQVADDAAGQDMDLDERITVRSFDQSVYSYVSTRDAANLLKELQGRVYNNQNPLYFLPADEKEFGRLDKQHLMLLIAAGGLFAAPDLVRARLEPEPGVQKAVLDLGTGGGNWAISVAQEFPHVEVVGVDLAPSTTRPPPINCRFEFDDVTLGLPHYHGRFDVVHARSTANGVPAYENFITECGRCLKPGGVLLLTEGEFQLYDDKKEKIPVPIEGDGTPNQCWYQRLLFEAYHIMKARGSSMDSGYMLPNFISRHPWFENAGYEPLFICCGSWRQGVDEEDTHKQRAIGMLMRQNSMEFFRSLRPLFLSAGYPEDVVDRWIARADKETETDNPNATLRIQLRWHYAWATLKADHSLEPHVPLPPPLSPYSIDWPVGDVQIDMSKFPK